MPFSRRCTICVTNRLQKYLQWTKIFDLDLQVTLTFMYVLVEYKHIQFKVRKNMFYSFNLDPMTLVLKLDLDLVKMYLHTKNVVASYSGSKVMAWTYKHTDRQTHTHTHTDPSESITYPHTRMVKFQFHYFQEYMLYKIWHIPGNHTTFGFSPDLNSAKVILGKLNCHQRPLIMPHEKCNNVYHLNLPPKFAIP